MSTERIDRNRKVVETVESKWDDAADRCRETVTASRPMTELDVAQYDVTRCGRNRDRMRAADEASQQSAVALLRRLERTVRAGRKLLQVAGLDGSDAGTLQTVHLQVNAAAAAASGELGAATRSRRDALTARDAYDAARQRFDAALREERAVTP